MQTHQERPAESAGASKSVLARRERQRKTLLRKVARLRKRASAEIDRLILFLDACDPYTSTELEDDISADLEDGNDGEPSLGSIADGANSNQARWADGSTCWFGEGEGEHDGAEPDEADYEPSAGYDTGEPSLGWTVDGCVDGGSSDWELDDCDDEVEAV